MAQSRLLEKPKEIRVMIVGTTGVGKSALGNLLMNKQVFESKISLNYITTDCATNTVNIGQGQSLQVTDTPGFSDVKVNDVKRYKKSARTIRDYILESPLGPHVFLLTIEIGVVTQDDFNTIKQLKRAFGENFMKYVSIVFTHDDKFGDGECFDDFIVESHPFIDNLLQECHFRRIAINGRLTGDLAEAKRKEVIELIRKSVIDNKWTYYSHKMLKETETKTQQTVNEMKKKEKDVMKELRIKIEDMNSASRDDEWMKRRSEIEKGLKDLERVNSNDEDQCKENIDALYSYHLEVDDFLKNARNQRSSQNPFCNIL